MRMEAVLFRRGARGEALAVSCTEGSIPEGPVQHDDHVTSTAKHESTVLSCTGRHTCVFNTHGTDKQTRYCILSSAFLGKLRRVAV